MAMKEKNHKQQSDFIGQGGTFGHIQFLLYLSDSFGTFGGSFVGGSDGANHFRSQ
jgi:hypothetical protein